MLLRFVQFNESHGTFSKATEINDNSKLLNFALLRAFSALKEMIPEEDVYFLNSEKQRLLYDLISKNLPPEDAYLFSNAVEEATVHKTIYGPVIHAVYLKNNENTKQKYYVLGEKALQHYYEMLNEKGIET